MFSIQQKRDISTKVQEILRATNHPELPEGEINFHLHVDGAENWSWADIEPNWTYDQKETKAANPWNEIARDILKEKE